jgi:hypothetical protein
MSLQHRPREKRMKGKARYKRRMAKRREWARRGLTSAAQQKMSKPAQSSAASPALREVEYHRLYKDALCPFCSSYVVGVTSPRVVTCTGCRRQFRAV